MQKIQTWFILYSSGLELIVFNLSLFMDHMNDGNVYIAAPTLLRVHIFSLRRVITQWGQWHQHFIHRLAFLQSAIVHCIIPGHNQSLHSSSSCHQWKIENWIPEWFCEVSEYLVCWSESWARISDNISGIDWGLSLHTQCYLRNILTAEDFYSTIDSRCMSPSLQLCDRKYLRFTDIQSSIG